jgi:galactosamine-6-phosphate isomerase
MPSEKIEEFAMGITLINTDDHEAMSEKAATFFISRVREKPDLSVCFPTGNTPTRFYKILEKRRRRGYFSAEQLRATQLDEWLGMPRGNKNTCRAYLRKYVKKPLHISDDRFLEWDPYAANPEAECIRMEVALKAQGPLDLTILGVGMFGHLGLNEAKESGELYDWPHVATLSESTRAHPMISGLGIKCGMTLGMRNILESKEVLLLVSGAHKLCVMKKLRRMGVSPRLPVSYLHTHPSATIICTKDCSVSFDY